MPKRIAATVAGSVGVDRSTASFERTEQRLNEWGTSCRENAEALGMPTISGIARMIAHVQAETAHDKEQARLQKKAIRKAVREARKAWKEGDPPIDSKLIAEELGYAEHSLSAQGKETKRHAVSEVKVGSNDLKVDYIVANLPNWMHKTIVRSYQYGQPDRCAAQDLRVPKMTYRLRRIAAVEYVAERLNP